MYIVDDAANRSKLHPRNSEDEDVKVLTEATGDTGSSGLEVLLGRYSFHPLYIVAPWLDKENGCKEMLTVAAVIPSGLGTEDVTVELNERGNSMKIGCTWPAPLVTPDLLCEYFIKDRNNKNYTTYHPEVNSLESALKDIRTEAGLRRSDDIVSHANILLPFEVEKDKIEKFIIPFKGNPPQGIACHMLLVRLYKFEELYDEGSQDNHPKLLG